ncbi:unnamed protein product [Rhizophagus irregularis]|nr:unnamed protein product [Rhizophagus irregularis]
METWYGRTIIKPCAKLSYENAQEIEADIKLLHELAQRLRDQRFKRGALSLGSIRLNFELDEQDDPIELLFPEQALLRRHAPPIERRLNDFMMMPERY